MCPAASSPVSTSPVKFSSVQFSGIQFTVKRMPRGSFRWRRQRFIATFGAVQYASKRGEET